MKRIVIYILLLALLVCLFPCTVFADETESETNYAMTFSVGSCSTSGLWTVLCNDDAGFSPYFKQCLYDAFVYDCALVYGVNATGLIGFFWDDLGRLCMGRWVNPLGVANSSMMGLLPLSSLDMVYSASYTRPVFFSISHAEAWSDFLTSSCYAICWDVDNIGKKFYCYFKDSIDASWLSYTSLTAFTLSISTWSDTFYFPRDPSYVTWYYGDVSTGEAEETTIAPPVVTSDFGGAMQYLKVGAEEPVLTVSAAASNGGTLSYQWYVMDCLNNTSRAPTDWTGTSITVPTDTEGMYMYWCAVTETLSNGVTVNAISSTFCVHLSDVGNNAVSNYSWYILDDGTLVVTGTGAIPDFSSGGAPWYAYKDVITSIYIGDGINVIGTSAFRDLSSALSVRIPDTLVEVRNYAFHSSGLLELDLSGTNLISLGVQSFANLGKITEIYLPDTCGLFAENAFGYCWQLRSIFVNSLEPFTISSSTFANLVSLSAIYVPAGTAVLYKAADGWSAYADIIFEMADSPTYEDQVQDKLDQIGSGVDELVNGNLGFDSSGSDFSSAAVDLQNSSSQMSDAMSGGMDYLGGMVSSAAFLTTVTTLGSAFDAVFEGHEVTICGVTANPFVLLVSVAAMAILIPLALKYVFRKRGGGGSGA